MALPAVGSDGDEAAFGEDLYVAGDGGAAYGEVVGDGLEDVSSPIV
jgi:hypothetical protein